MSAHRDKAVIPPQLPFLTIADIDLQKGNIAVTSNLFFLNAIPGMFEASRS
jgi:hypothetical protein